MTYLVDWGGVRIADDKLTLGLLGKERPGSILVTGCGNCASCAGLESDLPDLYPIAQEGGAFIAHESGTYGTVAEAGDWTVPTASGTGKVLERSGNDWIVSEYTVADYEESQGPFVTQAPWYHASTPATGDFLGAIVTDMQGLMNRPTGARVVQGLADGGWVAGLREGPREIRVKMSLLALSESGLNAGQAWVAGIVTCDDLQGCGLGSTLVAGVACPGERERYGIESSSALSQLVDRQLVGCVVFTGPEVVSQMDSCGLWRRDIEFGVVSQRGKLMRPTINHLDDVAGTSGPGVAVNATTGLTVPALCPPTPPTRVMTDPNSTVPPVPIVPEGESSNRTTFSHKQRVAIPTSNEPWVERALSITLHASVDVPGARVRVFHQSDYTSCGEVAEFYVQWINGGFSIVVDAIEGEVFAWKNTPNDVYQGSHLVRSIYADGFFKYPTVDGGDSFYVLVESEGAVGVSIESAVIE